ncbi:MAG: hypothetical protein B7Z80_03970 [Rhodospirillales bacterium 20-64-7]|nr:MAG: hypothetical protein B7Z80_03970 [Rhodospirillales bacterium 20-64-7]HQT77816.1 phosphatidate cytidylyltransferase [Rhodopila sp.]
MRSEPALSPQSRAKTKWGDLRPRVLSALVLIPVALLSIWMGGYTFAALVALAAVGMAYEWLGLCQARGDLLAALPFAALPVAVLLITWGAMAAAFLLLAVAMLVSAVMTGGITLLRPLAFGIPYLGLGALALVWLRQAPAAGLANVIGLLVVVWASDIGAYAVGRAFGGPLLAPAISPGKTWSGAVGGLAAAAAMGACAAFVLDGSGFAVWRSVGIAMLIGLVAQLGDLFESRLKRHFGVKDSGGLIPGHGGLLDRLDALLAAAPVGALLALVLGRGVILWK